MKLRTLVLICGCVLQACSSHSVREGTSYTVRRGDTLFSIARHYGVDYRELARWNGIGRDYQIYPGQVLRFHAQSRAASAAQTSPRRPPAPSTPPPPSFKWMWPTSSQSFAATTRPNGGIGLTIRGSSGQEIHAAAAGKVVYVGVGLLGYGQLLIVKHDETYLSAYGYTQGISVREGEQVYAGQTIATMGEGPAGAPMLYFEIRANGRPVDPLSLLPRQE